MLSSLLLFGLVALGLSAALALFVSLKREFRLHAQRTRARLDEVRLQLQNVQLQNTQRALADPPPAAEPPVALRSGMNLTKRTQALRLLRRGEDISHVAAALGVPRREIELLVRVQKLSAQRAAGAGQ